MNVKNMRKECFMKKLFLLIFVILAAHTMHAQRVALKTNALYWATLSPNLGTEFRISRHYTLNLEVAGNPFKISDKFKTHFAGASPELRYWFSGRPQTRHFAGIMGLAAGYSLGINDVHHRGTAWGGGLTYGYSFVLSKRWSLETSVGAGVLKIEEKKYHTGDEVPATANRSKIIFAPMKLGISFVYILK